MKKKLWLIQLPVVTFFSLCFWVTELGVRGDLENAFMREKVFPALSRATNVMTDLKFKTRGPISPKNKVVVVDIDSPALETLGRWPWHRDVMAYLIEKTFQAGAKVVGLDMIFSEADVRVPQDLRQLLKQGKISDDVITKFETDHQLEEVIRRYRNRLVLGWVTELQCQPLYEEPQFCPVTDPGAISQFPPGFDKFSFDQFSAKNFNPTRTPIVSFVTPITNIQEYSAAAQYSGFLNAFLDSDGYIRRTSLLVFANGKPHPSLPLDMARVGLNEKLQVTLDDTARVKTLGFASSGKTIPVTPLGALQINFRGPSVMFPHVPALDIVSDKDTIEDPLNQKLTGLSKAAVLKDAYVIIGLSAIGVYDMRQFPFESNAPGVDGHANILDNILSGDPLIPGASGNGSFLVLFFMIVGVSLFAFGVERLDAVPALVLFAGSFSSLWYLDFKYLFTNNYNLNTSFLYLEMGTVFILTLAGKYIIEERNKKFIRGAFAKYVTPEVVDSILKDPTKLSLGGEKRELTILFSDIRGFTTFSEKMDAKALASFLNDYLGIMTGIVFQHQGTLDKYIGDAVMAFWGAPLPQSVHALNACKAAVEMMKALESNAARFKSQYGIEVNIGIGINSGVVNVGNMGSEQNFEYTVIGDHVNLASRVEGMTKKYGVAIVTTRFTLDSIQKSNHEVLPHRVLDEVKVKGKKIAVELVQLFEKEYSAEGLKLFAEGRGFYRLRKWTEAIQTFEAANRLLASNQEVPDGPCEIYLDRCRHYQESPPALDWDGSFEMESK